MQLDDAALVGAIQKSDPGSREALYHRYKRRVFGLALRIVGASDAEEVAQDVFFELYGQLSSLASEEHVVHWLRRVTVHRSIDQARRRLRRPQDHAAVSFAAPGVAEPAAAQQETDPWLADRLQQMIAPLTIVPRTVIVSKTLPTRIAHSRTLVCAFIFPSLLPIQHPEGWS